MINIWRRCVKEEVEGEGGDSGERDWLGAPQQFPSSRCSAEVALLLFLLLLLLLGAIFFSSNCLVFFVYY